MREYQEKGGERGYGGGGMGDSVKQFHAERELFFITLWGS